MSLRPCPGVTASPPAGQFDIGIYCKVLYTVVVKKKRTLFVKLRFGIVFAKDKTLQH